MITFIVIVIIVVLVVSVITMGKQEDQIVPDIEQRNNIIVNVTLKGGLIGMLADSPQRTLNQRIKVENDKGWRVVQIIPADSGNIFLLIFRVLLLMITLGFYTTVNGYYIVFERIGNFNNTEEPKDKGTDNKLTADTSSLFK